MKYLVSLLLFLLFLTSCKKRVWNNPLDPEYEFGTPVNIPFQDDFSTNRGWASSHLSDFQFFNISGKELLSWIARRSVDQEFYFPIIPFPGKFELSLDFMITNKTNNSNIDVGLVSNFDGNIGDSANNPQSGIVFRLGWTGGGTEFSIYYIQPIGFYSNGTVWYTNLGDINPGGTGPDMNAFIPYLPNQWYKIIMTISDNSFSLNLLNSFGNLIGSKSWVINLQSFSYNYIYIGNSSISDIHSISGYFDNLKVNKK